MKNIIQTIKENWQFPLMSFGIIVFMIVTSYSVSQIAKIEIVERNCQCEITKVDVECMIHEAKFGNRSPKEAFENLESESIWKGEDLMTRNEVINIIKTMDNKRDLMDELYFLRAVDGSVAKPTFIPFFCNIYEQCKNEK